MSTTNLSYLIAGQRPGLLEKLSYGTGDLAFNFYWTTLSAFGLIFYTDVFGISPIAAGTMLLVSRIFDAFSDPVIGALADRTQTRFGRFRPYLMGGIIPLSILGIVTFSVPNLSEPMKLVYAYISYNLLMLAYTVCNIPYNALSGVMSANTQDRTTLNSFRFVGGFLGGTIVTYCTPWLVAKLGGGTAAQGWPLTMAIYGVVAIAILSFLFSKARERIAPPLGQKTNPLADIADLMRNRPWLVLFALALIIMVTITLRMSTSAYYMRYVVERPDLIGGFLTLYGISLAAGAACTPILTRFFDKKHLMMGLMALVALLSISFYFIPKDQIVLMFVMQILIGLCLGPKSPLAYSMYADTADFTEYKTGRRATAMTYAAATFSQKLGGALASFIIGAALSSVGYVANAAQSADSRQSILLLMSIAPGIVAAIAVATVSFYSLNKTRMAEITQELLRRRSDAHPDQ
ncbi:MAG: MFS transporter [Asticcacaulis sp.]